MFQLGEGRADDAKACFDYAQAEIDVIVVDREIKVEAANKVERGSAERHQRAGPRRTVADHVRQAVVADVPRPLPLEHMRATTIDAEHDSRMLNRSVVMQQPPAYHP